MRYLFKRHDKSLEAEETLYESPISVSVWHKNKVIRRLSLVHHIIWIPHYGLYLFGRGASYFFKDTGFSFYNVIRHRDEGKNALIDILNAMMEEEEPVLLEEFLTRIAEHWFFSYRSSIMKSLKRALMEYNLHLAMEIFMQTDEKSKNYLRPVISIRWKKPPRRSPIEDTPRYFPSRTKRRIQAQRLERGY